MMVERAQWLTELEMSLVVCLALSSGKRNSWRRAPRAHRKWCYGGARAVAMAAPVRANKGGGDRMEGARWERGCAPDQEGAVGTATAHHRRCTATTWWPLTGERRVRPRAARGRGKRAACAGAPFIFFLKFFSQIDFKHILSSLKSFLEVAPKIKVTQNKILYNFAFKVQTKNPIGL